MKKQGAREDAAFGAGERQIDPQAKMAMERATVPSYTDVPKKKERPPRSPTFLPYCARRASQEVSSLF